MKKIHQLRINDLEEGDKLRLRNGVECIVVKSGYCVANLKNIDEIEPMTNWNYNFSHVGDCGKDIVRVERHSVWVDDSALPIILKQPA